MANPHYPYIRRRLREMNLSQGDIARALGITRQAVNYGLRLGSVSGIQQYVAQLLGDPVEKLFPPPQKRGPKPKSYWDRDKPSSKTRRCA